VPYSHVMDQVEIPTETWVVHDLRKSNVLEWAARYNNGEKRQHFLQKANSFYQNCFRDLEPYPTKTCTRPLIILLQYGIRHGGFQAEDVWMTNERSNVRKNFGVPQQFNPQRRLAEGNLKVFCGISIATVIGLFTLLKFIVK